MTAIYVHICTCYAYIHAVIATGVKKSVCVFTLRSQQSHGIDGIVHGKTSF